ncbi:MAG TPA: hypothetical protein PKX92_09120 [Edaphocola sp.]|nr:hypothetical protein [Edaphocola sp.]
MKKVIGTSSIIVLFLSLMTGSCGKNNKTNQGIDAFIPTDTQNWWRYEANDGTKFKRYYTGRDTVVNGFSFNLYEQISDGGTIVKEFYAKFNGNYYSLLKINDDGTAYVKSQILNGEPKVGDTWENQDNLTYNAVNFYAKINSSIISTTDTVNMNGATLDNVVVVKSRLFAKYLPTDQWEDCGYVIQKFKKGVGIVGEDYDFHVGTFVNKTYNNRITEYYISK